MGSSEQPVIQNTEEEEEVDLDADTKESTEEVFLNEETAESPHKITLFYDSDIPSSIAQKFPKHSVNLAIGKDATLGRHKDAHVLLYDKHMARSFAAVTCRTNTNKKVGFFLRNACDATKEKRIQFTDMKGVSSDLLPTQEVELVDGAKFRLECVEFRVELELGDLNAKTFGLQVSHVRQLHRTDSTSTQTSASVVGLPSSFGPQFHSSVDVESSNVGFSLPASMAYPSEQVVPKRLRSSAGESRGQNQGQGQILVADPGTYANFQMAQGMPQQYVNGGPQAHYPPSVPHPQAQYFRNTGFPDYPQHGYPSPSQYTGEPSGMQQPCINQHTAERMQRSYANQSGHAVDQPLISRGELYQQAPVQYNQRPVSHPCSGLSMGDLAQGSNPRGITLVTTPSSVDKNPVLYPSPSNQRFRFPPPDAFHAGLDSLPRGPPLGNIPSHVTASGQSIDLHPVFTSNRGNNSYRSEIRDGCVRTAVENDEKQK